MKALLSNIWVISFLFPSFAFVNNMQWLYVYKNHLALSYCFYWSQWKYWVKKRNLQLSIILPSRHPERLRHFTLSPSCVRRHISCIFTNLLLLFFTIPVLPQKICKNWDWFDPNNLVNIDIFICAKHTTLGIDEHTQTMCFLTHNALGMQVHQ